MGKLKLALVIVISAMMVLYVGCSDSTNGNNGDEAVTTTLLGGNPSGVWFALSTAISESLGRTYEGSVMNTTPGSSYSNLFRLNDGEVAFALTHSTLSYEAYHGYGEFPEEMKNIRSVACFYPSVAHLALNKDLGVTTFDQIIENKVPIRITIGSSGGTGEDTFKKLISLYGLTIEDMEGWGCKLYSEGNTKSAELFADGQLDGMWKVTSVPTPTLTQAATNTDMVMVTFSDEIIDRMVNELGYTKTVIKSDAYKFMTSDYRTFNLYTILAASADTPDDVVYKVAKSIRENLDYIRTVHSSLADLGEADLMSNMEIPMHPGAEQYYRDAGLLD